MVEETSRSPENSFLSLGNSACVFGIVMKLLLTTAKAFVDSSWDATNSTGPRYQGCGRTLLRDSLMFCCQSHCLLGVALLLHGKCSIAAHWILQGGPLNKLPSHRAVREVLTNKMTEEAFPLASRQSTCRDSGSRKISLLPPSFSSSSSRCLPRWLLGLWVLKWQKCHLK